MELPSNGFMNPSAKIVEHAPAAPVAIIEWDLVVVSKKCLHCSYVAK